MEESAPKRRRTSPRTSLNTDATPTAYLVVPAQSRRPSYASPTTASLARHDPQVPHRRRSRSPRKSNARPLSQMFNEGVDQSPSELLASRLAESRLASDAGTPMQLDQRTPGSTSSLRRARGGMAAAARRTPSRINPRPVSAVPDEDDFNPFLGKRLRRSPGAGISMPTDTFPASMPEPELPIISQTLSQLEPPASMPELEPRPLSAARLPTRSPTRSPSDSPVHSSILSSAAAAPIRSSIRSPSRSPPPTSDSPVRSSSHSPPGLPGGSPVGSLGGTPVGSPSRSPISTSFSAHSSVRSPVVVPSALTLALEEPVEERVEDSVPSESSPSPGPPASMSQPDLAPLSQLNEPRKAPSTSQPVPQLSPPKSESSQSRGFRNSPVRWREVSKSRDSSLMKPPSRPSLPRKFSRSDLVARTTQEREQAPIQTEKTASRKTVPFDPDLAKKEERQNLLKEIETLKKDLEIAGKENERIRLMQSSGQSLAPSNQDEVLDLIRRQYLADNGSDQTASQQLAKAALNPAALLPFGKALSAVRPAPVETEKQVDIRSHHPVLMKAEDELAYLELFTPFSITSNIAVLPREPNEPLKQLHSITLRSRKIPGIFTARIEMIVNALDLAILDLKVVALEPAARPELGPFLNKICSGDCNRTMQRNIGVLSWAMGEWLRVAIERAIFWCGMEKRLGSKEGLLEATGQLRARKPRRRRDGEEDEEGSLVSDDSTVQKADLLRYMGQQVFDVTIPNGDAEHPRLRLEWKTEFDWTGEAQNKLAVKVGAPGKCKLCFMPLCA